MFDDNCDNVDDASVDNIVHTINVWAQVIVIHVLISWPNWPHPISNEEEEDNKHTNTYLDILECPANESLFSRVSSVVRISIMIAHVSGDDVTTGIQVTVMNHGFG
jgi:hypothetical protein